MKIVNRAFLMALISTVLMAAPVRAEPGNETGHLVLSLGYSDFDQGNNEAANFRLDYRHGRGLYFIKPWIGVEGTSDGAFWGGAGIYTELPIYDRLYLTASVGAGGYSQGDGKDLGYGLEFRSTGEATYRFDNGTRLGVSISHISNAGLGDINPGVDILSAVYAVPLGSLIPN